MAPEPFVDLTQALPRSCQTLFICGMFGIGTPPLAALPNCARYGSLTLLPATTFAGIAVVRRRQLLLGAGRHHVVRHEILRRSVVPVVRGVLRDQEALDAEEGTDGFAIAGTWITLNFRPAFFSVSMFQGPVIQNAA